MKMFQRLLVSLLVPTALVVLAGPASADVSKVGLVVGRLATPQSCFVQVDVQTDAENKQNGQEKLLVGDTNLGTWASLVSAGKSIAVGKSVLYGSAAFATEAGITPDITVPDASCEKIAPNAVLTFNGSFGPVAGTVTLPADFSALDVVGLALSLHLDSQTYTVKSLSTEKSIGTTGSTSGTTPPGTTTPPAQGTSSGSTPTSNPPADDSSCTVGALGTSRGGLSAFAVLGIVGIVTALRRRRLAV